MGKSKMPALFLLMCLLYSSVFSLELLSLQESIRKAIDNNPSLSAISAQVLQSEAGIGIARSQYFPKLNFTQTFQRTNNPPQSFFFKLNQRDLNMMTMDFNNPGISTDFESKLQVVQPVYFGGLIHAGYKMSKKEFEVNKIKWRKALEDVSYQTSRNWYQLIIAKQAENVARKAYKDAQEHVRITQANYDDGRGMKSDMLRAKVLLSQMEQNYIQSETQVELARQIFNTILGSKEIKWDAEGKLAFSSFSADREQLINYALTNRSEVLEMHLLQDQAHLKKVIVQSDFMPSISLIGQIQLNSSDLPFKNDANSWFGALVFSFPVFDGFARNYKLSQSNAGITAINESLNDMVNKIQLDVNRAYLELRSAENRIKLTQNSEEQAEESLRLTELRYQNGLATITDVMDMQTSLNQTRLLALQALADYNLSIIGLNYSTGKMLSYYDIQF